MLNDFGVTIPKEENDKVDTLRYSFQKLMVMSVSSFDCYRYAFYSFFLKKTYETWPQHKSQTRKGNAIFIKYAVLSCLKTKNANFTSDFREFFILVSSKHSEIFLCWHIVVEILLVSPSAIFGFRSQPVSFWSSPSFWICF